jgi:hypothetical protein
VPYVKGFVAKDKGKLECEIYLCTAVNETTSDGQSCRT